MNLSNAVVNTGDPVYWDENSGPSLASENSVGTIPSESFTVLGSTTTSTQPPTCFQSQGNLQIIYNFTQQEGNPFGVTIDNAGNLYGVIGSGNGLAYKLARFLDWMLDPLFSFLGGYNGGYPFSEIVGPNGTLYGGAPGGIQNCGSDGSQYCGLVYNLTPPPTACLTSLCSWIENVPYRFTSESDGSAGSGAISVSAYDQAGNLYGTTSFGGAYDAGTVFELTLSGGGWTKTTLYSFTGGNGGSGPGGVLVGNDGNLYGIAGGGMYNDGLVFQLTPSGGQWTESVLHAFNPPVDGESPGYLVQDTSGNLYGIVEGLNANLGLFDGGIFVLVKTSSGWNFSETPVDNGGQYDFLNNLAIDEAGNLYGTGYGGVRDCPPPYPCSYYSFIFQASYGSGGWQYRNLDFLNNQYFHALGGLALDSSGNLYGTTYDCGANGSGTVWQLSP